MSLATGLTSSMTSGEDVLSEATDGREDQNPSKEAREGFQGDKHGPGGYPTSSSVRGIPT